MHSRNNRRILVPQGTGISNDPYCGLNGEEREDAFGYVRPPLPHYARGPGPVNAVIRLFYNLFAS